MRVKPTAILVVPVLAFGLLYAGFNSTATAAPTNHVAIADARSGDKDAKAMLEHAVSYLEDNSPARAFAAFNNQKGSFHRNDLYTFVVGIEDGIMYAHGGAPEAIVGADVRELRDAAGKLIVKEMLAAANQPNGGTVNYVWLNRVTNRVEDKTTQVRKVGKYMVGVGYYTR